MKTQSLTLDQRIKRRVAVDANGCWRWQGYVGPNGYGLVTIDDRRRIAHRAAYEAFVGPIADGMQLDHLCRVRDCVNPEHLEQVTPRENVHRSTSTVAFMNAAKTHCPQGHAYDEANTYRPDGRSRVCRACVRENHRRYRLAKTTKAV